MINRKSCRYLSAAAHLLVRAFCFAVCSVATGAVEVVVTSLQQLIKDTSTEVHTIKEHHQMCPVSRHKPIISASHFLSHHLWELDALRTRLKALIHLQASLLKLGALQNLLHVYIVFCFFAVHFLSSLPCLHVSVCIVVGLMDAIVALR